MIDFGDIVKNTFPEYGSFLIDISHVLLGMIAFRYPIVFVLFVIYQVLDIKRDDHLVRDFVFFGVGYGCARLYK